MFNVYGWIRLYSYIVHTFFTSIILVIVIGIEYIATKLPLKLEGPSLPLSPIIASLIHQKPGKNSK